MIDKQVVCGKLAELREKQASLERLAGEQRETFLNDPVKIAAAERWLQVAIEICLDLGHHVIASLSLPRPAEYRDVFRILGDHDVLTKDLASRLEKAAGFRNRLVHVYGHVDRTLVWEYLQNDRSDLQEFSRALADRVKQQKPA